MQKYQADFLTFSLNAEVLKFGQFVLKSGRTSPYFFNSGLFNTGKRLAELGRFYAQAIIHSQLDFNMLYGPAYKGIPLVAAISIALADHHDRDVPYAFNRKEAKAHGEGGSIVGSALEGKVLIVDDVISAGTSIRESIAIINEANAIPSGVMIALDRQEKGEGDTSAIQEIEANYHMKVSSIVKFEHLLLFLKDRPGLSEYRQEVEEYRRQYGDESIS